MVVKAVLHPRRLGRIPGKTLVTTVIHLPEPLVASIADRLRCLIFAEALLEMISKHDKDAGGQGIFHSGLQEGTEDDLAFTDGSSNTVILRAEPSLAHDENYRFILTPALDRIASINREFNRTGYLGEEMST